MNTYYHILSWSKQPATCYGIRVNENGVVTSLPMDGRVDWMRSKKIDDIVVFFEDKPAIITKIIPNERVDNNEACI